MYIGDLGEDATRSEIEEAFEKYGYVRNVWIAKRPPGIVASLKTYIKRNEKLNNMLNPSPQGLPLS